MDDFRDIPFWIEDLGWRYYSGPAGIGGYTTKRNAIGYYHSFFLRPAGEGARTSVYPEYYKYVKRLTSKRRKKTDAMLRSKNLAYGRHATAGVKAKPAALPGTGYCTKEKKTVFVDFTETITVANGRKMIRGSCPDCGTHVQKFGRVIDCPNCGKTREAKADDYLCRWCREEISSSELQ